MRGPFAQRAEIVRRADDAASEAELPDAVDHDPRGERMARSASHSASARRRPSRNRELRQGRSPQAPPEHPAALVPSFIR